MTRRQRPAALLTVIAVVLTSSLALAAPRRRGGASRPGKPGKPPATGSATPGGGTSGAKGGPKVFDFTGLDLAGRLRSPQLLYFLERAQEELERARLQKRSFMPELRRSVDEEGL